MHGQVILTTPIKRYNLETCSLTSYLMSNIMNNAHNVRQTFSVFFSIFNIFIYIHTKYIFFCNKNTPKKRMSVMLTLLLLKLGEMDSLSKILREISTPI